MTPTRPQDRRGRSRLSRATTLRSGFVARALPRRPSAINWGSQGPIRPANHAVESSARFQLKSPEHGGLALRVAERRRRGRGRLIRLQIGIGEEFVDNGMLCSSSYEPRCRSVTEWLSTHFFLTGQPNPLLFIRRFHSTMNSAPFAPLQSTQAGVTFPGAWRPSLDRGIMWSITNLSGRSPQ